ncbi:echinoderm microtubule-associated protein-like 2 isoform X2 [Oppia nitens]|uniref:echinoderm microtubule-associated protein-like 2 isoform X2 n=1 Tax=Oppia nitens TaxID=1686743 RepID=UPI0023DC4CF1|nr:echinoderm microtubule-associated protein-like 2 isoform X2 [Oppia nitens]
MAINGNSNTSDNNNYHQNDTHLNNNLVDLNINNDDSFLSNSTGTHADHEHLQQRVVDLERKLSEQCDEIVCLRSTLADVLRRVTQLEGRAPVITTTSTTLPNNTFNNNNNNNNNNKGIHLSSLRSYSNSSIYSPNNSRNNVNYNNNTNNINGNNNNNTNGINGLKNNLLINGNAGNQSINGSNGGTMGAPSGQPVVNGHRRLTHYPSNNSLHSNSDRGGGGGGHSSSNSGSPVPSPSPSQSSNSYRTHTPLSGTSPRHTPQRDHHRSSYSSSTSNLVSMRKWSASQEFRGNPMDLSNRRMTSGSLFNLHVMRTSSTGAINHIRHGTKEATHNQEDGIIRIYLRGHPLVVHIPTDQLHSYSLNKVNSPPTQRLKLEWVYGYRGRDCRHNLFLLPTGEIVYFIAAVVVLYNVEDQIQRHYLGHTDDIKCLTVHPNRLLIATGQVASLDRAHVRIWDSVSLNTLHIIGQNGDFDRSILCLAFSKLDGGNHLCVIDESNEHTISLWDWQKTDKGHKITETKTSCDPVLAVDFHPMDRFALTTVGKGHIHFWDMEGGSLSKKLGIFEKQEKPKYILCMAYNDMGELLTGDSNGNIMVWQRGSNRPVRAVYGAHDGGVFTICVLKDGSVVTGGGKDKRIVEWDFMLSRTGREAKLPDQFGGVRTLTTGKGSMLMVGTTKNCILQGTLALNFSLVVQGHTEELWALAIHPTQNQFITAGYDKTVHLWDTLSHTAVWSKDMGEAIHSAAFSPDGSVLVFTTTSSRWIVMDSTTRQMISMHSDGNEQIDCVKFSPDGRFLALGSRDNHIYVYQVSEEYRKYNRIGRCSGHSSFITHLDFTRDGTYIQSCSGDYEHLFWNATICRQLNNMSIARDLDWQSHNSVLGFNVLGIWPENADGSDVNTCDRSHSGRLLATGDDFGKINVYSYPAPQPKCLNHSYGGHSGHLTGVRFMADDSRLISIGGRDSTVMQWTVS